MWHDFGHCVASDWATVQTWARFWPKSTCTPDLARSSFRSDDRQTWLTVQNRLAFPVSNCSDPAPLRCRLRAARVPLTCCQRARLACRSQVAKVPAGELQVPCQIWPSSTEFGTISTQVCCPILTEMACVIHSWSNFANVCPTWRNTGAFGRTSALGWPNSAEGWPKPDNSSATTDQTWSKSARIRRAWAENRLPEELRQT